MHIAASPIPPNVDAARQALQRILLAEPPDQWGLGDAVIAAQLELEGVVPPYPPAPTVKASTDVAADLAAAREHLATAIQAATVPADILRYAAALRELRDL